MGKPMAQPTDVVTAISQTTTVTGGAVAMYFDLSTDQLISLAAVAVMVASFAYQVWHTSKMREIARTKE